MSLMSSFFGTQRTKCAWNLNGLLLNVLQPTWRSVNLHVSTWIHERQLLLPARLLTVTGVQCHAPGGPYNHGGQLTSNNTIPSTVSPSLFRTPPIPTHVIIGNLASFINSNHETDYCVKLKRFIAYWHATFDMWTDMHNESWCEL